jgi:hypothetical protein
MIHRIARKLAVGVALFALVTPAVYAASKPVMGTDPEPQVMGTDPEPGMVIVILTVLGLA